MKNGFTIIELVFIIVIIGILSSIALPKLVATREDTTIATIVANARVALADFEGYYTSQGNTIWNTEGIVNVTSTLLETTCGNPVEANTSNSPNTFVLCHDDVICLSFETTVEGYLTIMSGMDTTDRICEAVKEDPAITILNNKTYKLGGEVVDR